MGRTIASSRTSQEATTDSFRRANNCSHVEEEDTSDAVVRRYSGGACGVTSVIVKSAGHVWPCGKARMGGEHDPKTVDATSMILGRFLSND